jgi:hypothetical protein
VKEPPQGVIPPNQGAGIKKPPHQPSKMRKFVAKYSAGLRVRQNPSLQSEQIGIIKPNGILAFTDEVCRHICVVSPIPVILSSPGLAFAIMRRPLAGHVL